MKKSRRIKRRGLGQDRVRSGWMSGTRVKHSHYADAGYVYEVRLRQRWIPYFPDTQVDATRDTILTQVRAGCHARIIGWRPGRTQRGQEAIRIYLRHREDLMLLRLLTDDVFRIYRLVSPASDDHSPG